MTTDFAARFDAFLQKHASSSTRPVAVFDCDGTIIKGDIGESMFYHQIERFLFRTSPALLWADYPKREELDNLYQSLAVLPAGRRVKERRFISFADMLLGWYFDQLAEGKTAKACSDIVRLFAEFSPSEVREIALTTYHTELQSDLAEKELGTRRVPSGIRYIREALELLDRLRTAGFDIWAISGSNKWSVDPVFARFGVPPERVIGIELEERENLYTARVKTPIPVLEGKPEALRALRIPRPAIVISDSHYDEPLFRYSADLKILVNSRNGVFGDFFALTRIERDDSWLVVDEPTILN